MRLSVCGRWLHTVTDRTRLGFSLVSILLSILPNPLSAQPDPLARANYLTSLQLTEQAGDVETSLLDLLNRNAGYIPSGRRIQTASFFSFVLTLNGLSGDHLNRLQEEGIDLVHAMTAQNRPLSEQSLFADTVVKGRVVERKTFADSNDETFVEIDVQDVFKGNTAAETIFIYQQNGREGGEQPNSAAKLEPGQTYIFLLSNALYRYGLERRKNDIENSSVPGADLSYVIYRLYEMEGDKLLWSGYNKRKTKKALKEVRKLGELLEQLGADNGIGY